MKSMNTGKQAAVRLSRVWDRASDKVHVQGVPREDIGKSLVASGVSQWLKAGDRQIVALGLAALLEQIAGNDVCGEFSTDAANDLH